MKRINYKIGFVLLLGLCCRPVAAQQRVDVEKDLQYCHRQVARALADGIIPGCRVTFLRKT